jgi:hypothetical protein
VVISYIFLMGVDMIRWTRCLLLLSSCLLVLPRLVQAQELALADRIRIAEAFRLADAAEQLWPGWSQIPFAVLLVTREHEFLIRHPTPTDDFESLGRDEILDEEVLARPRVFEPQLLATFPAVAGVPTLVIGTSEVTGLSSTEWVLTALHEHFHQLQMSDADYYPETAALDLSGGDESGMWMLDYPFPYDSSKVATALEELGRAAGRALDSIGSSSSEQLLSDYLELRARLPDLLADKDYRYLSFQLWQEGLARYTQLAVASMAAADYEPMRGFQALKDYIPYSEAAAELRQTVRRELESELRELKRIFFYPLGAVEGLLLDEFRPGWRESYLIRKFYVERYFTPQ